MIKSIEEATAHILESMCSQRIGLAYTPNEIVSISKKTAKTGQLRLTCNKDGVEAGINIYWKRNAYGYTHQVEINTLSLPFSPYEALGAAKMHLRIAEKAYEIDQFLLMLKIEKRLAEDLN